MQTQLSSHTNRIVTAAVQRAALLGQTDAYVDLFDELKRFFELGSDLLQTDQEQLQEFTIDMLHLMDIVEIASDPTDGELDATGFEEMIGARAYLLAGWLNLSEFDHLNHMDLDDFIDAEVSEALTTAEQMVS